MKSVKEYLEERAEEKLDIVDTGSISIGESHYSEYRKKDMEERYAKACFDLAVARHMRSYIRGSKELQDNIEYYKSLKK